MTFITATFLRRLSVTQRDELIKHAAGPQPFIVKQRGDEGRWQTLRKLIELRLIKPDADFRPRSTELTLAGREAAAALLGEYADALVAAGCLEEKLRPLDLVALLKAEAVKQKLERPVFGHDYDRHRQRAGRSQT